MTEQKTKPTPASVDAFLQTVADEHQRLDSMALVELLREVTGEAPRMWGGSIVGFGSYHYRYASGHEGDAPLVGFSPRKQALTVYLLPGLDRFPHLLGLLGKHKTGKGCLYLKKLADVDLGVLKQLAEESVQILRQQYG